MLSANTMVGVAFKDVFICCYQKTYNPIIVARLAVAHVRHIACLTRYRFTGGKLVSHGTLCFHHVQSTSPAHQFYAGLF